MNLQTIRSQLKALKLHSAEGEIEEVLSRHKRAVEISISMRVECARTAARSCITSAIRSRSTISARAWWCWWIPSKSLSTHEARGRALEMESLSYQTVKHLLEAEQEAAALKRQGEAVVSHCFAKSKPKPLRPLSVRQEQLSLLIHREVS